MYYSVADLTLHAALDMEKALRGVVPEGRFVFDFSHMHGFGPLSLLVAGTAIRQYMERYPAVRFSIAGIDAGEGERAGAMGFFRYAVPSSGMGSAPGGAAGGPGCIPITRIDAGALQQAGYEQGRYMALGDILEKESGRLTGMLAGGNGELHKLLTYLMREMLRNTPEHAQTSQMWVCGQYCPSGAAAEIAVMDEGIGLYRSLTRNPSHRAYITDPAAALRWAVKAGISRAFGPAAGQRSRDEWANSGFGLYMASTICRDLGGSFCIISSGRYLCIDSRGVQTGETSFSGTAVGLRVPAAQLHDAQGLISAAARKGEAEARTIRNAFKKASVPSKGLMTQLEMADDR